MAATTFEALVNKERKRKFFWKTKACKENRKKSYIYFLEITKKENNKITLTKITQKISNGREKLLILILLRSDSHAFLVQ